MTDQLIDQDEQHLQELGPRFLAALEARRRGDIDTAAELLRQVLKTEPRLAEPRMELANILLSTGQIAEAEEEAREAIRILESGGRWTEDVEEHVLQSIAWGTLGEIIRTKADSDEVIFGDPDAFASMLGQARAAFDKALQLDPDNEHAAAWSHELGVRPKGEE